MREKHVLHFNTGVALMLDCLVNVMVIFMSFKFSSEMYDVVCTPASRMCQYCCNHLDLERHQTDLGENIKRMEQEGASSPTTTTTVEMEVNDTADPGDPEIKQ